MQVTATQAKNRFVNCCAQAKSKPVFVKRMGVLILSLSIGCNLKRYMQP